jgi:KDO2-lipid IV(A) lauroyltransferase
MTYRLLHTLVRLLSCIPFRAGQFLGKMLGTAASLIPLGRRDIVLDSIRGSFRLLRSERTPERIASQVFLHFGQMCFEVPHILRLNPGNLGRYVLFENEENLINALRKKKGVFILTGHFGNWELMSAAAGLRFGNTAAVVRPIDFPPADRLIRELRSRFGEQIIPKQRSMRTIMAALRDNKAIGILLDQNVDWYEGAFVDFLGKQACANKGLALLALRTGAPVIPAFSVRQADGRYRIIIEKEVELIRTGDKTRDVEDNTALFSRIIEGYIRRYPDHWFWFHRRWKTRPYCPLPESYYQ